MNYMRISIVGIVAALSIGSIQSTTVEFMPGSIMAKNPQLQQLSEVAIEKLEAEGTQAAQKVLEALYKLIDWMDFKGGRPPKNFKRQCLQLKKDLVKMSLANDTKVSIQLLLNQLTRRNRGLSVSAKWGICLGSAAIMTLAIVAARAQMRRLSNASELPLLHTGKREVFDASQRVHAEMPGLLVVACPNMPLSLVDPVPVQPLRDTAFQPGPTVDGAASGTVTNLNQGSWVDQSRSQIMSRMLGSRDPSDPHTAALSAIADAVLDRLASHFPPLPPEPQLEVAVKRNDIDTVTALLDSGMSVNGSCEIGDPLRYALENNNEAMVRLLLDRGAQVNIPDRNVSLLAIALGFDEAYKKPSNVGLAQLLLDAGADINQGGIFLSELPLLAYCVGSADLEAVRFLLDNGANDLRGSLCEALRRGVQDTLVAELQAKGAIVTVSEVTDYIVSRVYRDPNWFATLNRLLDAGINPNAHDSEGDTPLHAVIRSSIPHKIAVMQCLLDRGAYVDGYNKKGFSPFMKIFNDRLRMSLDERFALASFLLTRGADINLVSQYSSYQSTVLHQVMPYEDEQVIKFLLENNARVDIPDSCGMTVDALIKSAEFAETDQEGTTRRLFDEEIARRTRWSPLRSAFVGALTQASRQAPES
jgi:ankyrin repeat protein